MAADLPDSLLEDTAPFDVTRPVLGEAQLCLSVEGLAVNMANKYARPGTLMFDGLLSAARLGALKAARRYDPVKYGTKFSTLAHRAAWASIIDAQWSLTRRDPMASLDDAPDIHSRADRPRRAEDALGRLGLPHIYRTVLLAKSPVRAAETMGLSPADAEKLVDRAKRKARALAAASPDEAMQDLVA